jgi:capsular exopolysaccharide synthesis family protein
LNLTSGKKFDSNCESFQAEEEANRHRIDLPKYGSEPVAIGGGLPVAHAVEAYKSLRSRIMKARNLRGISSIVITSTAHSEGKTLTAFNLAYCCALLDDTPVLMVDGDLRVQGLSRLAGNQRQFGLRDVLGSGKPYASAVAATDVPNLYLMGAGGGSESPAELLSGTGWRQFMAWASESFQFVLVDSPPIGILADFSLIESACGGSLVVVRAHRTTRRALEEALGQTDSKKLLGVVWNDDDRNPERYSYNYLKA